MFLFVLMLFKAVFISVAKTELLALHQLIYAGLKISRRIFNQSEAKPKPIAALSHPFPRVLHQLHGITSSFDWFTVLSVPFVIGQSHYFAFGFTTLN